MLKDDILFFVKDQANKHMFNIIEIIVALHAIMLLTNRDIGDKRAPRRLVDVTKDRARVGQLRERILVFHPACAHAHTRTYSASRVQTSLSFFFSSLRPVGRRSGRGPLWARYTSHDVVCRVGRRCRKRVRFNAVLLPPAYNTHSPPIALLSFCSLRAFPRARYTYRAALSLRSAFVATVKLALRGTHLSLIPEANPPNSWTKRFHAPWFHDRDGFRRCQRSAIY